MNLIEEIQQMAADESASISSLLMKCKILAAKTKNKEFGDWVNKELDGYESLEDVPGYRFIRTHSFGTLINPVKQMNNVPIPPGSMPEKYSDFVQQEYLLRGISMYEELVKNHSGTEPLRLPWPADLIALVADQVYTNMSLVAAWKILTPASIKGMLGAVRAKILDFTLEIEHSNTTQELPHSAENKKTSMNSTPSPQQFFIQGNAVIGAEGANIIQNTILPVQKDDISSLRSYLDSLKIDKTDIEELEKALNSEKVPESTKKLGPKVSGWIGKMVSKAASGAWNIAASVATDVLVKGISNYYGLPL
jgi:hypothetical protein